MKMRRIKELDLLRAIAIIVLLIAHLHGYVESRFLGKIFPFAAHLCISLFVFVSGFVINYNTTIKKGIDVISFLRRRLLRIYLLYVPSLLLFLVCYPVEKPISVFVVHLFSLQVIFGEFFFQFFTLWFVGLIVPYYVLYALVKFPDRNRLKAFFDVLPAALLVLSNSIFSFIDARFFIYIPVFMFGVFLSEKKYLCGRDFLVRDVIKISFCLFVIFLFLLSLDQFGFNLNNYVEMKYFVKSLSAVFVSAGLLFISKYLTWSFYWPVVVFISNSSYAVYLFHRPFLSILKNNESAIENSFHVPFIIFICFFAIPLLFVLSRGACVLEGRIMARISS